MTKKTRELIFYTTRVNDQLFNLQLSYFHLDYAVALPSFERFFQARDKFRADYGLIKNLVYMISRRKNTKREFKMQ
jgi:hypothetical protein